MNTRKLTSLLLAVYNERSSTSKSPKFGRVSGSGAQHIFNNSTASGGQLAGIYTSTP
jgi:hypothetical protein